MKLKSITRQKVNTPGNKWNFTLIYDEPVPQKSYVYFKHNIKNNSEIFSKNFETVIYKIDKNTLKGTVDLKTDEIFEDSFDFFISGVHIFYDGKESITEITPPDYTQSIDSIYSDYSYDNEQNGFEEEIIKDYKYIKYKGTLKQNLNITINKQYDYIPTQYNQGIDEIIKDLETATNYSYNEIISTENQEIIIFITNGEKYITKKIKIEDYYTIEKVEENETYYTIIKEQTQYMENNNILGQEKSLSYSYLFNDKIIEHDIYKELIENNTKFKTYYKEVIM